VAKEAEADLEAVKALFQKAADIAKQVPESMQGAAFHRALDVLLGARYGTGDARPRTSAKRKRQSAGHGQRARRTVRAVQGTSRRSRRPGAPTALRELAETDFFRTPRTIGEIQGHLESSRALRFTQPNLSPHLGNLVRGDVLEREKNEQGIYEYRLP
jgi:hypothetical protein